MINVIFHCIDPKVMK